MQKSLSGSLFQRIVQDIIGKPVSKVWISFGYTLYVEIGDFTEDAAGETIETGEYSLIVDGPWVLSHNGRPLTDSSAKDRVEMEPELIKLVGLLIDSATCNQTTGETQITFQDGFTLRISDDTYPITWSLVTREDNLWVTLEKTASSFDLNARAVD